MTIPALVTREVTRQRNFCYRKLTSLSGTAEKITIQQPASGAALVRMQSVTFYASVATVFTLSMNGTAATGTAGTPVVLSFGTALANVFHTSNAGAGTVLNTYRLAAGEQITLDLSAITLEGDGTAKNVSVATDSVTGDVEFCFVWSERPG
jgi:hypothetical protein